MGKLPRMNEEQLFKARRIIQNHCCNYDNGYCIALDGDLPCECVQWYSYSLLCKHFHYAVLPNDRAFEAELHKEPSKKKCTVCGAPIFSKSNRAIYCEKCTREARRKKERERKQKSRSHVRI